MPEQPSSTNAEKTEVTGLLRRWRAGDPGALESLLPKVYAELHRLADSAMRGEGQITLQPTALVAEAYLRLIDIDVAFSDRVHFFAVAANLMRRILIDEARRRKAQKRGGARRPQSLEALAERGFEPAAETNIGDLDLVRLDEALLRLEKLDRRKSQVIELRFFAGLTIEETAIALSTSHATVERDLKMAKAWLAKELKEI